MELEIGHIANFKIGISKVQNFGNFERSPMKLNNVALVIILSLTAIDEYERSMLAFDITHIGIQDYQIRSVL